jgi:hypothetical protein
MIFKPFNLKELSLLLCLLYTSITHSDRSIILEPHICVLVCVETQTSI